MAEKGFKRKLTAILSADVEGYSRLMGDDEEATVRTITAYREVMATLIKQHNGKELDYPGGVFPGWRHRFVHRVDTRNEASRHHGPILLSPPRRSAG